MFLGHGYRREAILANVPRVATAALLARMAYAPPSRGRDGVTDSSVVGAVGTATGMAATTGGARQQHRSPSLPSGFLLSGCRLRGRSFCSWSFYSWGGWCVWSVAGGSHRTHVVD
ncbi:hypothetical protein Q31a_00580 [Aureliella helgolandensis]|uniref:Uncharacterized protein n=1 Tax=Aureliella helgolandensis TaxID=2527968 RepID=A0A518FZJ5_9BACT|nr:hypothetical protein Q31a_00580 [Aureliella helgolandensis]